jgi:ABC-2 type transport system ATP-binding protein
MAAIEAAGLRKAYGSVQALRGLDLEVPRGGVCALLGPNGAGKTTAIRVLATLTRPDAGWARVAVHDVVRQPRQVRAAIGMAGQHAAVDDDLTGRENLLIIGLMLHLGRRGARARADELLVQFGLAEAGDRLVRTWSGGMRRRLDVVASLLVPPQVLFLDEPATGLDPRSRADIWAAIAALAAGRRSCSPPSTWRRPTGSPGRS